MVSGVSKMIQMCVCVYIYIYISQMVLVVKNWGWIQVGSLGQEDPLEGCTATHSSILACLENPMNRSLVDYSPQGHKETLLKQLSMYYTHTWLIYSVVIVSVIQ